MRESSERHKPAKLLWALCVAVLMGPALLVWAIRLSALGCTPGPQLCYGMPLGAALRDALALCWGISNTTVLIAVPVLAALLAFRAQSPVLGTLTLLALPVASLLLPLLAVFASRHAACPAFADGFNTCVLWGASMGTSFHNAAAAYDTVCEIMPYTVALTVVMGVLGFFFARPKPVPPHAMAHMQRPIDKTEWGGH